MLLTLDTATPYVSVAVHDGTDVVAEVAGEERMRHGEQLAPSIERTLALAGIDRLDLTAIGVGVGPGPFTGLRVGVVTARVLAHALGLPGYGVCSLDVLAVEAVASGALAALGGGPFVVASDARRKEVHVATYDEQATRLEGPVVAKPEAVATALPVVGEGALLYPDAFTRPVGPTRVSAGWLARTIAGEHAELLDPDPLYLRRPDAVARLSAKRVS